ncbi:MAG: hypothetical protein IKZ00_10095 [Bacteroidaceae bacterium]|nr:hypothetical protein [Bacteroidaceae bacterium]
MKILYTTNEEESPITWPDFLSAFDQMLDEYDGAGAIMTGTVGRWDGDYPGGCHVKSSADIFPFLKDCEIIIVSEKDGHLHITASHHDGTNRAEIRMLTSDGANWYEMFSEMMTKKEAFNTLMHSDVYTAPPDLSFFQQDKEGV